MHPSPAVAAALLTLALARATATPLARPAPARRHRAAVTLDFIAGPARYTLTVPADDDSWHPTHRDLSVSLIQPSPSGPAHNLTAACHFHTHPPPPTYVPAAHGALLVGPPQPILAVRCPAA